MKKSKKITEKQIILIIGIVCALLILAGVFNYATQQAKVSGIIQGQDNAIGYILQSIDENSKVEIQDGDQIITLVREEAVIQAQEETIAILIEIANRDGYLELQRDEQHAYLELRETE